VYTHSLIVNPEDPHKVVKVVASDGKSGEQQDMSYTNCKVIGNGSFGVVFQAKVISAPKGEDDIAIKKVLQDKRFKVRSQMVSFVEAVLLMFSVRSGRIESCR
jgi:hypothetical protein